MRQSETFLYCRYAILHGYLAFKIQISSVDTQNIHIAPEILVRVPSL